VQALRRTLRHQPARAASAQLYCRPSHRVRAREKRREAETKQPSEKQVRLLFEDLTRLARQRQRFSMMPSNWKWGLSPAYERARAKVRSAVEKLAPEVFRQPSAPAQIELGEFDKTFRQLAMGASPRPGRNNCGYAEPSRVLATIEKRNLHPGWMTGSRV
jgi:hypothetical protein